MPVAREHHRARTSDVDERLRELPDQGRVERVVPVGARQRDPQEIAVALDSEVGHRAKSIDFASMLRGAIAAALTPLTGGGAAIDEDGDRAVRRLPGLARGRRRPRARHHRRGRPLRPRRAAARSPSSSWRPRGPRLQVAVHCGAQSTADTTTLAEHAALVGADAVAVIAPPYFALDAGRALRALRGGGARVRTRCRSTSTSSLRAAATRSRST